MSARSVTVVTAPMMSVPLFWSGKSKPGNMLVDISAEIGRVDPLYEECWLLQLRSGSTLPIYIGHCSHAFHNERAEV
jgi:hypothetical protein